MRILLIVFLLPLIVFSQRQKPKNYSKFDEKLLNFGFMLGFNSSDFAIEQKLNNYQNYNLISLQHTPTSGAQVGIVTTMKLFTPMVRLRMIPTLSFQERVLNYTFINPLDLEKPILLEERVGSTNFDIPLMLQFRTQRLNNFAAYFLVGGQ